MEESMLMAFSRMMTGGIAQRKSRQQVISDYEKKLENMERTFNKSGFMFCNTNSQGYCGISHEVKLQLKNRISIANLQVDKVHIGKFLLCRVISKCMKMNALSTIVEDPEGNVERISFYNWVQHSAQSRTNMISIDQASKLLPIGTKLIIKNPYYKLAADFDTTIRSDNPSDVIVLDHNNKLFREVKWSMDLPESKQVNDKSKQSADDFRRTGNDYFASNDFVAAVDKYSSGIKLEPNNVTLLANRAEAYLRLNQFGKALADVEIVLKHEPNHNKAAFRNGKALCGLKRYQEAIIILQDLHQRVLNRTDRDTTSIRKSTEELLKHAEMLVSESRNGQYNYVQIVDEFCDKAKVKANGDGWVCKGGPRLDHADFLIDDIEIRPVGRKGRGWVAKRDIPEHTLLMVSKAFVVVYNNEAPLTFNIDFTSRHMKTPTESELITQIAQKLMTEPELCQQVYQLYGGPDLIPMEELDENLMRSVDMKRIEMVVQYRVVKFKSNWTGPDWTDGVSPVQLEIFQVAVRSNLKFSSCGPV